MLVPDSIYLPSLTRRRLLQDTCLGRSETCLVFGGMDGWLGTVAGRMVDWPIGENIGMRRVGSKYRMGSWEGKREDLRRNGCTSWVWGYATMYMACPIGAAECGFDFLS